MEEMNMNMNMMMVMKMTTQETSPHNHNHHHHHDHHPNHNPKIPMITTPTSPTWKLYENPFYNNQQQQQQQQMITTTTTDHKQIHKLHLPISSRKIAASFFDLTFIKPLMDSELQSQITIVKSQLESAIRARKKTDSLNKKLARELSEERRGRLALQRLCEELAREISADKAEITRMRRDMDDERKMLRTAEIIREERVQMKLSDAKFLMEEKLTELQTSTMTKLHHSHSHSHCSSNDNKNKNKNNSNSMSFGEKVRFVFGEKMNMHMRVPAAAASSVAMQRKSGGENPHIKRGIKGFVEFPKVVRAIGCRSRSSNSNSYSNSNSKLECQKAQLKILLKQKGTLRFNGLIARS